MNFSVTQNSKPLDPSLYTWDEKTKTFSTTENDLVLDFSDIEGVTFKTGSGCTFNTGWGCTFNTGSRCTFKTEYECTFNAGSDCTFNTGWGCTFNIGSRCTFNTGHCCTFNTGHCCTFNAEWNCTFDDVETGIIYENYGENIIIKNNDQILHIDPNNLNDHIDLVKYQKILG